MKKNKVAKHAHKVMVPQMPNNERRQIKLEPHECIEILNLVIDTISLQDKIDRLNQKTLLFNPQIVRNCKTLVKSTDYIMNHIGGQLFNADMDALENAITMRTELLNDISRIRPENWQMIAYAAKWANEPKTLKHAQLMALCIAYDGEMAVEAKHLEIA